MKNAMLKYDYFLSIWIKHVIICFIYLFFHFITYLLKKALRYEPFFPFVIQ